jgi:hypothetical protein
LADCRPKKTQRDAETKAFLQVFLIRLTTPLFFVRVLSHPKLQLGWLFFASFRRLFLRAG